MEELGSDTTIEGLLRSISALAGEAGRANPEVEIPAVGVAIPGLADAVGGVWRYSCFSGIADYPIVEVLSSRLGLPVYIDNDVNACAFAERAFGRCRGVDDYLWVTVSNGVGGAVVLNGEIYRGAFGGSGEIGHIIVEEQNGRICPCGNSGCLEAQASGRAIAAYYRDLRGESDLDAREIAERAKSGDEAARQVYRIAGRYLGKAIAAAVNIMNPAMVVLGGGVSMDAELFLPEIRDAVDRACFRAANPQLEIEKTDLGYEASLKGAAALAWEGIRRESQ